MKSVRLDSALESRLNEAARISGEPISNIIREAIESRCRHILGERLAPRLGDVVGAAIYLLGSAAGWVAQDALWKLLRREDLRILELGETERTRTRALMEKYRDVPMDLADASLVAIAESLNLRRVFTLDREFHVYRLRGKHAFEILP